MIRKQPPGPLLPSAHAIDREYRVQSALAGSGVPVPAMLAYCDDRDVIGTPFYVMERVEGRVFAEYALPGCAPGERRAMYASMADTLAALHAVDPAAVGLADFGKAGQLLRAPGGALVAAVAAKPHARQSLARSTHRLAAGAHPAR